MFSPRITSNQTASKLNKLLSRKMVSFIKITFWNELMALNCSKTSKNVYNAEHQRPYPYQGSLCSLINFSICGGE